MGINNSTCTSSAILNGRRKTSRTLHLSRQQYRAFAELSKAAGMALNVSSYAHLKNAWGQYTGWALLVCHDVTNPETKWEERGMLHIAHSINTAKVRAAGAGRPELDWSVLEDHEIYPFVVQHEIGHRVSNFDAWGVTMLKDLEVRDKCDRHIRFVNELLADRYAWSQIRPGEPIPMSEYGSRMQDRAAEALEYLDKHASRMGPVKRPLAPGHYRDVPEYMLATPARAAFLGPGVSKKLVDKSSSYHRKRIERGLKPLY